jgi:hypothetical protein
VACAVNTCSFSSAGNSESKNRPWSSRTVA